MTFKKAARAIYFFVAMVFVYCFAGYFTIEEESSEYEKAINKLGYQIGYSSVYAPSDIGDSLKEMATTANDDEKNVYLTFDDGPSMRTVEILDILEQYNINATFFIVYSDTAQAKDIIARAYNDGHAIAVHSASHSYKEIYKSVDAFLNDFEICYNFLYDITGEAPTLFRFPGGSVNNYNKSVRKDIAEEMIRRGFTYFDWNVDSGDAKKKHSEDSIYNSVMTGCKDRKSSVVLMHDSSKKDDTVAALKRIIPELLEQGYTFKPLDENVQPTVFKID